VLESESHQIHLSVIVPAFNEETRIEKSLDRVVSFLQSQPYSSELIIIDDGSRDRTVERVRGLVGGLAGIRIHEHHRNRGKGEAVKTGMLLGNGAYLFFSDADLSVPIETLPKFLALLKSEADVVIGTRKNAEAVIEIHQPFFREFLGKTFTVLSNGILGLQVSDFTCGFKGFRRDAAKALFSRQQLPDWSFDSEILYLAGRKGYRVREVAVVWRNDRETKVRLWRDIVTSLLGLFRIRAYHALGRYR